MRAVVLLLLAAGLAGCNEAASPSPTASSHASTATPLVRSTPSSGVEPCHTGLVHFSAPRSGQGFQGMNAVVVHVDVANDGAMVCRLAAPRRLWFEGSGHRLRVTWPHPRPTVLKPGRITWLAIGFLRWCRSDVPAANAFHELAVRWPAGRTTRFRALTGWPTGCGRPELVVQNP